FILERNLIKVMNVGKPSARIVTFFN
ncbi:hypothetical protein DBR06_SOUSAS4910052, partial [Sousa chinensis]